MSITQFNALGSLLDLLSGLDVIGENYIASTQYYDTVETYRRSGSTTKSDSEWTRLYSVEQILIDD